MRDTGVGIPPAELPMLFERFHRIEGQKSRSFEGSGIGLALVQELVKLHGGTIRAESEIGKGTAFTISIPYRRRRTSRQTRSARDASRASTSLRAGAFVEEACAGSLPTSLTARRRTIAPTTRPTFRSTERRTAPRILVADDNADMRNYVRRLLAARWDGRGGFRRPAWRSKAIRARKPDLVLTDVMMPGLDGFGLLRELREDADYATCR